MKSHLVKSSVLAAKQPIFLETLFKVFLAAKRKKSNDFKTLKALREKVESILQTNSELYDIAYLDTVLKDYNYFTQKI